MGGRGILPAEVQKVPVEESESFLPNYLKGLIKDQFLDLRS